MCRYTHGMLSTVLQVSDGEGEEGEERRRGRGEERREGGEEEKEVWGVGKGKK
jgi:hypothetical protein